MARLDRMDGDREVAQLAATLGREFRYDLLAAVATIDEATLQAELGKLVQAEILYAKGRPPRCSYIFKHALLEDALYNALVKSKRQQFHRRIAEAMEAQLPADRRDAAGAARPPLHRSGPVRAGDRLLAQGGPALARAVGRSRGDRPPDQGPRVTRRSTESPARDSRAARASEPARRRLPRGTRLCRARGRPGLPPGARAVRTRRAATGALRAHARHLGVAHGARRPQALRGAGRRGNGIRPPPGRPGHHDGSAVHGG